MVQQSFAYQSQAQAQDFLCSKLATTHADVPPSLPNFAYSRIHKAAQKYFFSTVPFKTNLFPARYGQQCLYAYKPRSSAPGQRSGRRETGAARNDVLGDASRFLVLVSSCLSQMAELVSRQFALARTVCYPTGRRWKPISKLCVASDTKKNDAESRMHLAMHKIWGTTRMTRKIVQAL